MMFKTHTSSSEMDMVVSAEDQVCFVRDTSSRKTYTLFYHVCSTRLTPSEVPRLSISANGEHGLRNSILSSDWTE